MMRWNRPGIRTRAAVTLLATVLLPLAHLARAQDNLSAFNSKTFSLGFRFVEMSGEELFVNVCQGCHMANATGATGAGAFPSLVGDRNLEASSYPIDLVVNGRRAMPPFGAMMNDDQIAAVVNYLRTHFGNDYRDAVTAKDVHAARR